MPPMTLRFQRRCSASSMLGALTGACERFGADARARPQQLLGKLWPSSARDSSSVHAKALCCGEMRPPGLATGLASLRSPQHLRAHLRPRRSRGVSAGAAHRTFIEPSKHPGGVATGATRCVTLLLRRSFLDEPCARGAECTWPCHRPSVAQGTSTSPPASFVACVELCPSPCVAPSRHPLGRLGGAAPGVPDGDLLAPRACIALGALRGDWGSTRHCHRPCAAQTASTSPRAPPPSSPARSSAIRHTHGILKAHLERPGGVAPGVHGRSRSCLSRSPFMCTARVTLEIHGAATGPASLRSHIQVPAQHVLVANVEFRPSPCSAPPWRSFRPDAGSPLERLGGVVPEVRCGAPPSTAHSHRFMHPRAPGRGSRDVLGLATRRLPCLASLRSHRSVDGWFNRKASCGSAG